MLLFPRVPNLILAFSALFLAACASLPTSTGVGVTIVGVRPLQSTVLETTVEVTLRVTNESARERAFAGSSHRLYLNDSYVGRAVSAETVKVPAFGTATPVVTVHLENLALVRKAAEFARTPEKLAYRLDSRLHPVDGGWFGDLKVTSSGEIDLAGLGLVPPAR